MPTRLVLDKIEIEKMDGILQDLIKASHAKCAVVIEQEGRCLLKKGFSINLDVDAMAALLAGSFSSNKALADLMGERDFTVLFHQGEKDNIHTHLIDESRILSVIFDDQTIIETVRAHSKAAADQLVILLKEAANRATDADKQLESESETFQKLEDIFEKTDEM